MNKYLKSETRERGFTLIELLVVIVIIGVLAAIAIPIFTAQRGKAQDAKVASDMRTLAVSAHTVLADPSATVADLTVDNLKFASSPGTVWGVSTDAATDAYCLAVASDLGDRFKTSTPLYYDSAKGRQTTAKSGLCATNPPTNLVGTTQSGVGSDTATAATTFSATGNGAVGSVQSYTVSKTGSYKIEAWGASGGDGYNRAGTGGKGGYTTGTITLPANKVLTLVVGQSGVDEGTYDGASALGSGGGGGTFVLDGSSLLMVAGGGGGTSARGTSSPNAKRGDDATLTLGDSKGGSGGASANASGGSGGGGGAGFTSNGGNGARSEGGRSTSNWYGGNSSLSKMCGSSSVNPGGYGGGGSGGCAGAGGGGGYSGGDADKGSDITAGGGGSLYVASSLTSPERNVTGKANIGSGKVVITYLGA